MKMLGGLKHLSRNLCEMVQGVKHGNKANAALNISLLIRAPLPKVLAGEKVGERCGEYGFDEFVEGADVEIGVGDSAL
ncbi:hypothetical protein VNO77_07825 [Canavalia gladiata]|uniref:Uncharacterized protein n=1 Tax=Canavalia gladiata TaxID=3824 RepID=A0AAN9QWU1_CANGL